MSRSNNSDLRNPAQRFFRWSGSTGEVSYYDKETKENISVPLPFNFLVLDKLITIAGYSDADASGIWSNEIRNTRSEILTVRTKHGIKASGLYDEVKNVVGAKFCQSAYIAFFDDNKELQIGNLKLSGCAVSAWIEFSKGRDVYQGAIRISGAEEGKKGATKFFSPVFEQIPTVSEKSFEAANALDRKLQEYLTAYFAASASPSATSGAAVDNESYIEQRNRELEDFKDEPKAEAQAMAAPGGIGANDYRFGDDESIPF